jgi:putative hydrolase of the HAD superfamily
MTGVVFWDFDGTLGYRGRGGARLGFSTCLVEVMDAHQPGHGIDRRAFHPFLQSGFPWHAPDMTHLHLCEPDDWWDALNPVFAKALEGVGIETQLATQLSANVRARYADPREWALYDDVLPVFARLRDAGWHHVIVSNHVPELPAIASGLGLDDLVDAVHTSGVTGYEKPHPEMYAIARRGAGDPERVWMVGDNIAADYEGAERVGIDAILVRHPDPGERRAAPDLWEAAKLIDAASGIRP